MILTEDFHSKQQNIPKWRPRALPTCFPLPPEERFAALSCSKAAGKGLELGFQVPGGDRNPAVKCLRAAQVSPGRLYLCLDEFLRGISRLGWAGTFSLPGAAAWHCHRARDTPRHLWEDKFPIPACCDKAVAALPRRARLNHPIDWREGQIRALSGMSQSGKRN